MTARADLLEATEAVQRRASDLYWRAWASPRTPASQLLHDLDELDQELARLRALLRAAWRPRRAATPARRRRSA